MIESVSTEQVRSWLLAMVELQKHHNELVHPQWDQQNFPFNRAIWVECAELLDHFGWKWWKQQESDIIQSKIEIVDIWHFGLSALMVKYQDQTVDTLSAEISECMQTQREELPFREAVENVANQALSGSFEIESFLMMMHALPMTIRDLFKIYVDKNTLNLFRQNHGYKEGTYIKQWFGREDNEHLAELAEDLSPTSPTYMSDLEALLTERYHHVLVKSS